MKLTQAWTAASSVWVRSMEAAMLPVVWAALIFCTQATRAPASSAVCTADRPDSPAPTTTTSYSWVSAKSVMGSWGARNAGPVAAPVSDRPFSAAASATVLGWPQPASVLAPATPSAARPPNLNRSRRVTVVVMVNSLSFRCAGLTPRDGPHYGRCRAIAHRKASEKKIILVIFFIILYCELGKLFS